MSSNVVQSISETFEELGIWLCGCQGEEWSGVDPAKLAEHLYRVCPGVTVRIIRDLCTDHQSFQDSLASLSLRGMIVATCGDDMTQDDLRRLIGETGTDSHGVTFINVRNLVGFNRPVQEREKQAVRRLYALGQRTLAYPGTNPEQIAMALPSLNTIVSRRSLFGLVRPRYRVIPQVDTKRCAHGQGCNYCQNVCPVGALNHEEDQVEVVATKCTGCGSCLVACRFSSISFPTWSTVELEAEIEGLLKENIPGIAFICRHSFNELSDKCTDIFNTYEPVVLPSLDRLDPFLILLARSHGVRVIIISCPEECNQSHTFSSPMASVNFAQYLMEKLGFDPAIDWVDYESIASGNIFDEVKKVFCPQINYQRITENSENIQNRLANLISALADCAGKTEGIITNETIPFGILEIKDNRCTLCGVCTSRCSTGALTYVEKSDGVQLLFKHSQCIACGFCIRSCPEKALNLRKGVDFSLLSGLANSLANSNLGHCTVCGVTMAPLSLQSHVKKMGDICPRCHIGQQLINY